MANRSFGNVVLYHQFVLLETVIVALLLFISSSSFAKLLSVISDGLFFILLVWSIVMIAILLKKNRVGKILYVVPILILIVDVFGLSLGIYSELHTSEAISLISSFTEFFRYFNYVILLAQAVIAIYVIRKFNE